MVVCLAAGNDGRHPTQKAHIGAQAGAKNCITISACVNKRPCVKDNDYDGERYDPTSKMIGSPERIAAFSSTGPTGEDRIKPDVVAPGTMILSACSSKIHTLDEKAGASKDKGWRFENGTSMATPLVSGCVAILRQVLTEKGMSNPSAALIKAMIINGAVDIKQPVAKQDFGRVDLANSIIVPGAITNKDYWENGVSKDGTVILTFPLSKYTKSLGVATTAATNLPLVTLKATMVYMDMAGAELQNNLNLRVT